jgi:hypothetical protein
MLRYGRAERERAVDWKNRLLTIGREKQTGAEREDWDDQWHLACNATRAEPRSGPREINKEKRAQKADAQPEAESEWLTNRPRQSVPEPLTADALLSRLLALCDQTEGVRLELQKTAAACALVTANSEAAHQPRMLAALAGAREAIRQAQEAVGVAAAQINRVVAHDHAMK